MASKFISSSAAGAALVFCLTAAVLYAADLLTVVEREAAIRRDKRSYSPRVATVKEGDQVALLASEPPWLRVDFNGVTGWLPESSVTPDERPVLSGEVSQTGVRVTEQGAAKRSFSPEVEAEYRRGNPQLEAAFAVLKRIEEGWVFPDDRVLAFMDEGKIVPPPEGGAK